MKKIIVIGSPGAGKSCFSRELALLTKIRLSHIDNLYWRADRTHITHEELVCRLNEIMSEEAWIIALAEAELSHLFYNNIKIG